MTRGEINRDSLLTSPEVGSLLQVTPSSINKWVEQGRLQAFRTPGGHRRIRASDLVLFLNAHEMPVPRELAPVALRRLLLVDDDTKLLKSWSRVLKSYDEVVEVDTADNGVEALVKVGSFKPHLVILDVLMNGLDGIEVCRRLKASKATAQIDIIITSGRLDDKMAAIATKAGATRCVRKPINFKTLLKELGIRK